ncbi:MAG: cation acetate symporter, partial [Burkholderiales bacterium]|nr:cation acetate symporter [Burkholderiales bacterium]
SLKPADILSLVGAAFSLAASALFPALILGIFWKRANRQGAIAGIVTGFVMCVFYMISTHPLFGGNAGNQWLNIAPISAGVYGVPAGFISMVVVSFLYPRPEFRTIELIDYIREP